MTELDTTMDTALPALVFDGGPVVEGRQRLIAARALLDAVRKSVQEAETAMNESFPYYPKNTVDACLTKINALTEWPPQSK